MQVQSDEEALASPQTPAKGPAWWDGIGGQLFFFRAHPAQPPIPGSPVRRVIAAVLDLALVLGVGTMLGVLMQFLRISVFDMGPDERACGLMRSIDMMMFVALWPLAAAICHTVFLGTTGRTLGMRTMALRVVSIGGGEPEFFAASISRTVVPLAILAIPVVGPWLVALDFVWMFRRDARCLHDHLAGTWVVLD